MRIIKETGLTFDDVLLVPQYTEIRSRKDVSLKTNLTARIEIDTPIISSNMDTITEVPMMKEMNKIGGVGILHRFMSPESIVKNVKQAMDLGINPICFSVGISEDYKEILEEVRKIDPTEKFIKVVTIDVAHGACDRVVDAIRYIKNNYDWEVLAGNVATYETTKILCNAGADGLKVGVGQGGCCITRKIAGAGVPALTSIIDCYSAAEAYGVPIICDGGIKNSGDAVKALAAGASSVILGSMLAGTIQTPGETMTNGDGSKFKLLRGMASRSAMDSWRGDSYSDVAAEGVSTNVPLKGDASEVVNMLCAGIRSGMTYSDAINLKELRENAIFIKNTSIGFGENDAHVLRRI